MFYLGLGCPCWEFRISGWEDAVTLGSTDQALFRLAGAGAVQPPNWLWDSIRRICFPALAIAVLKSVGTESVGITRREGQGKSV